MMTAPFGAVRTLVNKVYDNVWTDWYSAIPSVSKATVETLCSDGSAAYSHAQNRIIIPIPSGNLDDPDILDEKGWPVWKIDLIHEMLHEWQKKGSCIPSPEADALHAKYRPGSCGDGHGSDFFQAVIEKAPYFQMAPEELVGRIG
ncbi:MAG: hypothetical protein ACHQIK_01225 [Candidatus Acidiferrales bacterium]